MKNLSSYCGLTDSRMRASEKDLPVTVSFKTSQEGLDKIFEKPSENGEVMVNTDVSFNNVENHVDIIVDDDFAVNIKDVKQRSNEAGYFN